MVLGTILAATLIGAAVFITSGMEKQQVDAAPTSCIACAKNFAPGHIDEVNPILDPKDDAPGQFDKKPIPD